MGSEIGSIATGAPPSRCNRQAAPDSASQANSHSSGFRATKIAAGAAIQRLRQLKQSIICPARLSPRRERRRTIKSAGPSSLARRCVTRQVARTARTNRIQNSIVSIVAHNGLGDWPSRMHQPVCATTERARRPQSCEEPGPPMRMGGPGFPMRPYPAAGGQPSCTVKLS